MNKKFLVSALTALLLSTSGLGSTEAEILTPENEAVNKANQFISENKESVPKRWYPTYHVAAPVGWINDPNGFCIYKGEYHLFYQHYPYKPEWGPMHWGHVKSADLIHWEHLPVAIAPTEDYEKNGCFSGSAIEKDDKLYLVYTGNVGNPMDPEQNPYAGQTQCLAISDDGVTFKKSEKNPIIVAPDIEDIDKKDFRDPKVWKHGDTYYNVIGSTNAKQYGQILLYESKDLESWTFKNIVIKGEGNSGDMWECPNFAEIDGSEAIIFSPNNVKPEGNKYLNAQQSVYVLGKMNYDDGTFDCQPFEMLDYGFDFYAPQTLQASDGRCIMIGWLDMWWSEMPESADNWCGMMSIPRELHIKDGRVISQPVRELEKLRTSKKVYKKLTVNTPTELDGIKGNIGEFEIDVDLKKSDDFELKFRVSEDVETVLSYEKESGLVKLNRDKSGVGVQGIREVVIPQRNNIKIHAYLDASSIEIFINDGEYVLSTRVYADADADKILIVPKNSMKIKSVAFYNLSSGWIN